MASLYSGSYQERTRDPELRRIVAVCISRKEEKWNLPHIPFYCHTEGFEDIPHYPRLKTRERIEYLARRRNAANKILLEKFPDTTDILQIDSYYLNDLPEIMHLCYEYLNHRTDYGDFILGASTWYIDPSRIPKRKWFWDTWTNPEFLYKTPDYNPPWSRNTPIGWQETNGAGGLAIYPRWVWEKQGYGVPDPFPESGCEANYLSRCPGVRTFITFNIQAWRDPPEELRDKPYVNRIRTTIGLRTWMRKHGIPDLYWILVNRVLLPQYRIDWLKGHIDAEGYRWNTRGVSDACLGWNTHENWLRKEILSQGFLFVDVGAHVGRWTLRASKFYDHVIAFEPSLRTAKVLLKNLHENHIRNVMVQPFALGREEGRGRMHNFRDDGGNSLLSEHPMLQNRKAHRLNNVTIRTLDSYELSPSLLKIDTEGYEVEVLEGAQRTLRKSDKVIVEIHSQPKTGKVKNLLEEAGLKTRMIYSEYENHVVGER